MKELTTENFRNIYQKFYDLSILANKMKDQQKLIDQVITDIFGQKLTDKINETEIMTDDIQGYYSNGESFDFSYFIDKFKQSLIEANIKVKLYGKEIECSQSSQIKKEEKIKC